MAKQMQAQASGPQWRDLRDWLELVDALGELKQVRGANSEEDIGAITEMLDHAEESPCVLFDEIPNYKPGYRVLVNGMGSRKRQALTLGLDTMDASHERLLQFWRELLKGFTPLPPVFVKRGAVQENILRDHDVNLDAFPAPVWHPLDGGRFIGTASINIMRDPDTGIINAGTYRNQVFDRNSIGIRAAPPHDGGIIKEKYMQRGQPCPIVTVVGSDPLLFLASCVQGPAYGESELDWAGGVRGSPIEVIQGEITGLPIPAHAEIALEGFITTNEFSKEGPYGEWMGYYQDGYPQDRVVRIHRIYHRDDPILLGCPQGKPPHEDNRFLAYLRAGMIWDQLEKAGVPGVCGVWTPPEGGNRLMTVVALKTQYLGHAKQAGLIASQCSGGIEMNRLTVVVDDHVDVTNIQDVVWAILARCDPERGVEIIKDTKGSRIDMAIAPDKRELNANSRMIIDATTPFTWKNDPLAGDIISTPERTRKILARWGWILE
ncbi:MAG TPA: UbiD family decarboxylase [Candidatus Udaeobacter sp.]|jgi:4-hydroxy-3-polyprenylbenzoate decarboxylase|nr:UbiD family decarboxylase [Candidatus Udaeobacter sp.]